MIYIIYCKTISYQLVIFYEYNKHINNYIVFKSFELDIMEKVYVHIVVYIYLIN